MSEITAEPKPEIWQHTDELGRVLLVKCVGKDGKSYNGFQWPKSGPVDPGKWSMEPNCSSGGLFGWAWGLNLGEGKEPEYSDTWIVFAAPANQVVDIDGKQKTGPAEVLYYGDWFGALQFTARGREQYHKKVAAWSQKHGDGTHSTGYRSASSATGDRSASSATGYQSASSVTGDRSASSATGDQSASSATGDQSAAIVTGELSTIEIGPSCVGVAMANEVFWRYRAGAVFIQRFRDKNDSHPHAVLQSLEGVNDGDLLRVVRGVVQK